MKKYYKKISSKVFTLKDLKKFAEYSADSNPQHVNPIHARRTISGQCVAHGIYVLMWALDEFTKKNKIPIISFQVDFLKPILIDILICCRWDENNNVLYISQKNVLLTTISIQPGKTIKNTLIKLKFGKARSVPKNLSIEDCKNYEKKIIYYRGKYTIGRKLFPSLNKIYGEGNLVELAATSEYVGMQIPGLNSLYLRIAGDFIGHNKSSKIKVQKIDKRFKIIKLIFKGKYLNAKINIFYSVTHAQMPRIDDFSKLVKFKNYNSVKALIIGGSRGLGEVTAKLVAWGGGESTITYNSGKLDAMRVQKEILRYGGICKIHYLDLRKN